MSVIMIIHWPILIALRAGTPSQICVSSVMHAHLDAAASVGHQGGTYCPRLECQSWLALQDPVSPQPSWSRSFGLMGSVRS